jgi:phenylpropionate dioxygenase-like ring-hydroxylating dioxygenase large terminal subunit
MRRDLQLQILDRVMAHRAAGNTTDMADDMYANRVDKYVREDRYAAEVDRLFRKGPVLACLSCDVKEPGDYLALSIADVPVLVARGDDGKVRAFRNVCRHRGACVAGPGPGEEHVPVTRGHTPKSFMCPYHAWTYGLDGRLVAVTHKAGFEGLDKSQNGLSELGCGEAAGLVFVQLEGASGPIDANAWLGGMADELEGFGLGGYFHTETRTSDRQMNWKLMFDTFGEVYHIQSLHLKTIHPLIQSQNSVFDGFGPHGRITATRWSITELDDRPRDDWQLLPHVTLVYHIVPNTVLIQQVDHVELYQIFPDGPGRSKALISLYAPTEPATESARDHWRRNLDLLLKVTETEDFIMCEQIQTSFGSGAQQAITFGRNEPGLIHYHRSLDRLLGLEEPAAHGVAAGG